MAYTGNSSKLVSSSFLYTTLQTFFSKIKELINKKSDYIYSYSLINNSNNVIYKKLFTITPTTNYSNGHYKFDITSRSNGICTVVIYVNSADDKYINATIQYEGNAFAGSYITGYITKDETAGISILEVYCTVSAWNDLKFYNKTLNPRFFNLVINNEDVEALPTVYTTLVTPTSISWVGNANTATALTTSAGSATQPIFFSGGKPTATTHKLEKSVPSNAIFTDTVYTLPTASSSTLGGVKTTSTVSSNSGYTACPIISGVPYYMDTNTTYTAGNGITLTGTALSNSGVRSIATGSANGTVSVNTNGTSADVAVKGLGSAAYTAYTAYATSGHTHNYAGSSSAGGAATSATTLTGLTSTVAELNFVDGVTSNIQTQLNGKAASSHTHNYAGASSAGGAATTALACTGNSATATNADTLDGFHAHTFQKHLDGYITDFNTTLKDGEYSFGGHNLTGAPTTGGIYGKLIVKVNDGDTHNNATNWIWQFAYCTDGKIYWRNKVNEGAWSEWIGINDNGNAATANTANTAASSTTTNAMSSTGFGHGNFTYYQTDKEFNGNSNWCHYLIGNYGNGASDYHYMIGLPFWGYPIYKRKWDGGNSGWQSFYTTENITYGTWTLSPGSSALATGNIYLQYE